MSRRKRIYSLCFILFLVFAVSECKKTEKPGDVQEAEEEKNYQLVVIPEAGTGSFWRAVQAGALKAALEMGNVDVKWEPPLKANREDQIRSFLKVILQEPDGVILAPVDNMALVHPVQEAGKTGIPVVIINSALEGEGYISYVQTDQQEAGKMAAREAGRLLQGNGNIIVLRFQEENPVTTARENGFLDGIKSEFPGLHILSEDQYTGPTSKTAFQLFENLLIKYPQVSAVYCSHDSTTAGVLKALKDIDKAGEIKLIGSGINELFSMSLGEGEISALVTPNPLKIGYQAVQAMMSYLSGDSVARDIEIPSELITRENIHDPEKQALLDPGYK
jgi:ribose transport system substrate-binding protein